MKILAKRAKNVKFASRLTYLRLNMKIYFLKRLAFLFVGLALSCSSILKAQEILNTNERNSVFFINSFSYHLIRDADDPNKVGTSCTSIKAKLALKNLDKDKEKNCKIKVDVLKELKDQADAWSLLREAFPHITPMKFTAEKVVNGLAVSMRLQNSIIRKDYFRSQSDCENTLKEYYRQVDLPRCQFEPKALDDVPND